MPKADPPPAENIQNFERTLRKMRRNIIDISTNFEQCAAEIMKLQQNCYCAKGLMINRKEFFARAKSHVTPEEIQLIARAYWFAKDVHRGQERDDGERYFEHCRGTARVLMEFGPVDALEIILALLHDCEEDRFVPQHVLRLLFGEFIAKGVGILSNVVILENPLNGVISKEKKSLDFYFQKIAAADIKVRRVKCADRLHNLQTMRNSWDLKRQKQYVKKTLKYVLPIAAVTDINLFEELKAECKIALADEEGLMDMLIEECERMTELLRSNDSK